MMKHLWENMFEMFGFVLAAMMFENVPAQVMIAEFPVKANTLSFSGGIFSTVP